MSHFGARSAPRLWRALVPVVVAVAALLLVTSAITANGTDLRASQSVGVATLIERQQTAIAALDKEEARLAARIRAATTRAAANDGRIRAAERAAGRLAPAAGLTAVTGPAVSVTLDDVPRGDQQRDLAAGARPDDLVIHQQDVQGVVNALWAGGAQAMTIMGERVIATTAVRCVGNTLLLRGRVYSPPFVVVAVGRPSLLRRSLGADPDVQVFQQYVAAYGLRYRARNLLRMTLPSYAAPLSLSSARTLDSAGATS